MKKTVTILAALLMLTAFTAVSFADILAPEFINYDVVVSNPDGAVTESGKTVPFGTALTVYGKYMENGETILTCYYKDPDAGDSLPMYINADDTKKITDDEPTSAAEEKTTEKATESQTKKQTSDNKATEAALTEKTTSVRKSTEAQAQTSVVTTESETVTQSETETDSSEYTETSVTETEMKTEMKTENNVAAKAAKSSSRIITACVAVSLAVAAMAAGTVIYVKKKRR